MALLVSLHREEGVMTWLYALLMVASLTSVAWLVKPKHIGTRFTRTPPVLARVNSPSREATEAMRQIVLPTGDRYEIPIRSRGHFVLVFDWHVPVRVDGKSFVVTVPKLSTTDFASIPRLLHSLISPLNNTIYAAILHDFLYRNPNDPEVRAIDRATADRMFYWGMRARGVWRVTAGIMYLGVRLGGGGNYIR